ncbi:MAG: hypothetical protein ACYCPT_03865, partial [Acidimicrobiales bacterium]
MTEKTKPILVIGGITEEEEDIDIYSPDNDLSKYGTNDDDDTSFDEFDADDDEINDTPIDYEITWPAANNDAIKREEIFGRDYESEDES